MSKQLFINIKIRQVYYKYKEIETDSLKMSEKNAIILSLFKESIEKVTFIYKIQLKTIEIHPKMQSSNERFLIDIYFDENKMNDWKEKCNKSQGNYTVTYFNSYFQISY